MDKVITCFYNRMYVLVQCFLVQVPVLYVFFVHCSIQSRSLFCNPRSTVQYEQRGISLRLYQSVRDYAGFLYSTSTYQLLLPSACLQVLSVCPEPRRSTCTVRVLYLSLPHKLILFGNYIFDHVHSAIHNLTTSRSRDIFHRSNSSLDIFLDVTYV